MYIIYYCIANLFLSCVQLAMRGPTGPMGLTGRPGPLVCIFSHLMLDMVSKPVELLYQTIDPCYCSAQYTKLIYKQFVAELEILVKC